MRLIIIAIFLATTIFGFILKYLTYSRRNAPLPENVKDVYDEESYKKTQSYQMEKLSLSSISGVVGMAVSLSFLLNNFHHGLYTYIIAHTDSIYLKSMFLLFVPVIISGIISSLIGIYDTFGIEAKYGFNKTTALTFITDLIKGLLIGAVIGGGLLSLFLFMYESIGDGVFLAFFFILAAFSLFINFISPLLIRIFYKLTPLEDGELKSKIEQLAENTGYKLKGIYMVNASKRSTKLNAFASGFGKTKTIGLFDTLLEKMTDDEVISVLAHEIGHAKKRHILKMLPLSLMVLGVMTLSAYFIITSPSVAQAFGFSNANLAFGIYVMFIMVSPLLLVLQIPSCVLSRKFEYEADSFAKDKSRKEILISALKKLYRESFANLTPHPFVVLMEHSHPTLSQRINALVK